MRADARRDLDLVVFLSNRCNLQCHYCAVEVNKGEALRLDEKRLKAGIRAYLDEAEGRKFVTLLGGEPFLDFPLIERVADFVRAESARRGEEVRLAVYTNGTLLSAARLDSLRSRGVIVWLSLDGKGESNDAHRTFRSGGRSVFAEVSKRLAGLDTGQMRANMVVHADKAADLVSNAEWFHRRGFPVVNFHPELWEEWTPKRLAALKKSLKDFGRWYAARWKELGRPPFQLPIISLVLDHTPREGEESPWWEKCDKLVLGADGRFRACERDVADDYALSEDKVIGDPENGIDWEKKEAQYDEARAILRARGADKEWHHTCPKGIVSLAVRRGWSPDRVLDSFTAVSRVFGEGVTALADSLRDLPGFGEAYPGAGEPEPPPAGRTFELLLSYDCNAKCAFCYNPPLTKEVLAQSIPFARAAAMLAKARAGGYDGVWFTGGDPTLRPDLDKLLLLSRKLGFRRVQIGTNAVRLASRAYADRLVDAGLNYARVSLHAASAEVHDRLLALPGAFDKALRGVEHLRSRGVYVGLNFVVTKENASELPAFFELCLGRLGVRDFDVIFLHHRGMMDLHGDALGVRYADAVPHLRAAWKVLEGHGVRRGTPTLVNIPPCVVPELAPWIADWSAEEAGDALTRPGQSSVDLMAMKGAQKTKGPGCASCALEERCLGFEREYAARYGDSDFTPIPRKRARAVR